MNEMENNMIQEEKGERNINELEGNLMQEEKQFCAQCGNQITPGQMFCAICGQKVGENLSDEKTKKKIDKRVIGLIAGVAVVAVIAVVFLLRGVQAKEVILNKETLAIKVGESEELTYTVNPENTKNKTVKWESSNDSVAVVEDGKVTAKNEGACSVTVKTKNGKTDICEVTVEPAGPDLEAIYKEHCDSSYASVASDGSYLFIDTNPDNSSGSDNIEVDAVAALYAVNEELGLPDSVMIKMGQTRSLDGMQSYEGEEIEINWTYHPDRGLEVTYSLIK